MTAEDAAEKVAESVWLKLVGRAAMVLALPVLGYVGSVAAGVSTDIGSLKNRVSILESTTMRGREDRIEFQRQTSDKLDEITAILTTILQQQAEQRAILDSQQRQIDRRR